MRSLTLAVTLLAVGTALAQGAKNADLEKAQKALGAKKYADALKSLEAAEKKGGLDLDSYSTLLESKGLCEASTKKLDKAEESFKRLLVMDPRRDMAGKYKGDVVKALDSALEWVKKNGGLAISAQEPVTEKGRIKQISILVKSDPLNVAKAARIHVKQADGTWKPTDSTLANGLGTADVDAENVEFWAEVHDAGKNQLFFVGSAIRPVKQSAPQPVAEAKPEPAPEKKPEKVAAKTAAAKADAPKAEEKKELTPEPKTEEASLTEEPKKSGGMLRPVSYALLGAGIIGAAVGVYFGASSAGARSQILADKAMGGVSQVDLYRRDQAAIEQAKIANGLFISAAVIAVIGVLMFVLGG